MLQPHKVAHAIINKPATPSHALYYAVVIIDGHYTGGMMVLAYLLFLAECRELMLDMA